MFGIHWLTPFVIVQALMFLSIPAMLWRAYVCDKRYNEFNRKFYKTNYTKYERERDAWLSQQYAWIVTASLMAIVLFALLFVNTP